MNTVYDKTGNDASRMRRAIAISAITVAGLWYIKLCEFLFGFDLTGFGVYPGKLHGLSGILFAPLIHSSWLHLAANSGPMLILMTALLYGYPKSSKVVLPVVYFATGILVWLFARPVYHIGASGVTFGMLFFITVIGFIRWDKRALALSLIVFFLYGGMMGGLFPEEKNISYETHIAAACLGIVLAIVLRNLDPPPPKKVYSWELEDEEEIDEWDGWEYEEDTVSKYETPDDERTLH